MPESLYPNWPDEVIYGSKKIKELIVDRSLELSIPLQHLASFMDIPFQELLNYLESEDYYSRKRRIKIWKIMRVLELLGVKPIIRFEINENYDAAEVKKNVIISFKRKMMNVKRVK